MERVALKFFQKKIDCNVILWYIYFQELGPFRSRLSSLRILWAYSGIELGLKVHEACRGRLLGLLKNVIKKSIANRLNEIAQSDFEFDMNDESIEVMA
jgi:hypothetical protein